jgi:pyruvate formate lyase activating enzyme
MAFVSNSAKTYEISALLDEALRSRPLFFDGGGVTLTGGEPTAQFPAVREFLAALKQNGVHTCIETNGACPHLPELFPLIDFLIADCKHTDSAALRRWTGQGSETMLRNIRIRAGSGEDLLVRVPLIGGVNTSPVASAAFAEFFAEIAAPNVRFEAILYHEYGKDKWKALGLDYKMGGDAFVDANTLAQWKAVLKRRGIELAVS